MAVALVHGRIGGEAIKITVALRIPHKDAFAARQNDTEWLVVWAPKRASLAMKSETGGPIFFDGHELGSPLALIMTRAPACVQLHNCREQKLLACSSTKKAAQSA